METFAFICLLAVGAFTVAVGVWLTFDIYFDPGEPL